jgi:hypothetical protein
VGIFKHSEAAPLVGLYAIYPIAPYVLSGDVGGVGTKGALLHGRKMVGMSQRKSPEMQRFNDALRSVLSVSKSDMQKMLEHERQSKIGKVKPGPKPRTSASGRAVSDRG